MAREKQIAEALQDIHVAKKSGALYISIVEKSEDLFRIYFRSGDIYHIRYGSAVGRDCLDLIEYYTLSSATWYDGIASPGNATAPDLPSMDRIIGNLKKLGKKCLMRS